MKFKSLLILSKNITSALTAVKDHVIKYSELLLATVMSIIFGPLKTLPRSSKSSDCVTFRVLKYLLSIFLLYTPHCHMILSKQKCCLWSTGVSTESQNLTYVLHLRQDSLASKIEKVPRGIRGEKSSKDMTSSRNLVSTIGALASPKMGDGTRCPEG